jgi:integrase
MVRFQRLTGSRPGEVCQLRPIDVDQSGEVWEYCPASHKTEHHGKTRIIYIGPQAQAVLRPYLERQADAYCFSPAESEEKRHFEQRAKRQSKVQPSQRNRKKSRPLRSPQAWYSKDSFRRAIARAINKANKQIQKEAEEMGIENPALISCWHPNQLRHSAATTIRKQFGLEAAQVILGHAKADVTQIYAERDSAKAIEVVKQIG